MRKKKDLRIGRSLGVLLAGLVSSTTVLASDASGNLFFTRFTGGPNVASISFNYDDAAGIATLGSEVAIVQAPGADGIIFAPNGNLLIGGQGNNRVYEYKTDGTLVSSGNAQGESYHLALDPSGTKVWTSAFGGDLADLPLNPVANAGPLHNVTGSDPGVTQLAFAPSGKVFYVNGSPNGFGNIGVIDLSTFVTTRFLTGIEPAHGMVYDPFTDLMTLFGAGKVGTFDPDSATPATTLRQSSTDLTADFDQGAVDGHGHALVAGANAITFIDYSTSGDITQPDYVRVFGGFINIDDVAPLSGLGSTPTRTPDGGGTFALLLLGSGIVCFARSARRA